MTAGTTEGGCLCGALRYSADAEPVESGYCHCGICRHWSGAPVSAWVSFPVETFHYTRGEPAIYVSSRWGHREFCAACGAHICYRSTQGTATVDIGSLDDPNAYPPVCHIYWADRVAWFETADKRPRYEAGIPEDDSAR